MIKAEKNQSIFKPFIIHFWFRLNLYFFEAYDRGEDLLEDVDPNDVVRIVQLKDSIIETLSDEVSRLNEKISGFEEKSRFRSGTRVKRRIRRLDETFITREGVNFINVNHANFLYEHRFRSFYYVHITREKLPKQHLYKKFACIMLMKLTIDRLPNY